MYFISTENLTLVQIWRQHVGVASNEYSAQWDLIEVFTLMEKLCRTVRLQQIESLSKQLIHPHIHMGIR